MRFIKKIFPVCLVLVIFGFISLGYYNFTMISASKFNGFTIVIDAGHGGRDGGSVGKFGTVEKEINLEYAYLIKNKLVEMGYKVELTRKNDDGLYSELASNKKLSDLNERIGIIKKVKPNLMISIHMNSFNDSSAKGAVTYYRAKDGESKKVADLVQSSLNAYCDARFEHGKVGDYYILNNTYYTSILIECGFISNPTEEKLLNSEEYKQKFTNAVCNGIGLYFGDMV